MTSNEPVPTATSPTSAPLIPSVAAVPPSVRTLTTEELFHGERLIHIIHGTSVYRLLITARGRLILQK